MAQNARLFMQLTSETTNNDIDGEARVKGFEKQIEIADWSWSVGREEMSDEEKKRSGIALSNDRKRSRDSGWPEASLLTKPAVFSFSKQTDRSTITMLNALTKGQLLKARVTLTEKTGIEGGEGAHHGIQPGR
jgi:type VI protein secretion system component Hcp